jgi:hypothetical protein
MTSFLTASLVVDNLKLNNINRELNRKNSIIHTNGNWYQYIPKPIALYSRSLDGKDDWTVFSPYKIHGLQKIKIEHITEKDYEWLSNEVKQPMEQLNVSFYLFIDEGIILESAHVVALIWPLITSTLSSPIQMN